MSTTPLDRLAGLIFRVKIPDGRSECYGTGFFICREYALTAFHNLTASALEDPDVPVEAEFQGETIEFRHALPDDCDLAWQKRYDVAVLKTAIPIDVPLAKVLYLNEEVKGRNRSDVWRDRSVVAVGLPANRNGPDPFRGRTPNDWPLREVRRIVDGQDKGSIPDALRFGPADGGSLEAPWGLSGSPVFDEELEGIIGVVVAAGTEFHATELVHVVRHWPAGKPCFQDIRSLSNGVMEKSALRRRNWVLPVIFAAAAAACALALVSWLQPGLPKTGQLVVELERPGAGAIEVVKNRITAREGEKLRFLIRSPVDGYLYVVDREFTRDGTRRTPYLVYPTLSTGVGENRVKPGSVIEYPDKYDSPPTIEAKPSQSGDVDYAGEQLTVMVYDSELLTSDNLKASSIPLTGIPLTAQQFPDDGGRLLFSSEAPELMVSKKIKLVVVRRPPNP
jgi:hypothetical protein